MRGYPQEVRRRACGAVISQTSCLDNSIMDESTFVPAVHAFCFESFPQTIYRVLIKRAFQPAVWTTYRGLVVHACQSLEVGSLTIIVSGKRVD
jgi:hypothetical protein